MGNLDDAMNAYERALRANPSSIPAMNAMSLVLRTREDFPKAAEFLNAILKLDERNGEAWGSLGAYLDRLFAGYPLTGPVRTLLFDDGRPPASVHCISNCLGPSSKPKG
jgi:tetratricopeptide (TPR) repeat protein